MPYIDRITIRGFKSIRALDDLELRPLTVLIGPNGSGKSNLLAAFRMLSALAQGVSSSSPGRKTVPMRCCSAGENGLARCTPGRSLTAVGAGTS